MAKDKKPTAPKKKKAAPKKKAPPAIKKIGKKYYDRDGKEITHKGTINLLLNKAPEFEKGKSGNPKGRRVGSRNRSTVLRDLLGLKLKDSLGRHTANPFDKSQKKIDVETALMVALIKKGLAGDVRAIQEVQDTMYGKMKETKVIEKEVGVQMSDDMTVKQAHDLYKEAMSGDVVIDDDGEEIE